MSEAMPSCSTEEHLRDGLSVNDAVSGGRVPSRDNAPSGCEDPFGCDHPSCWDDLIRLTEGNTEKNSDTPYRAIVATPTRGKRDFYCKAGLSYEARCRNGQRMQEENSANCFEKRPFSWRTSQLEQLQELCDRIRTACSIPSACRDASRESQQCSQEDKERVSAIEKAIDAGYRQMRHFNFISRRCANTLKSHEAQLLKEEPAGPLSKSVATNLSAPETFEPESAKGPASGSRSRVRFDETASKVTIPDTNFYATALKSITQACAEVHLHCTECELGSGERVSTSDRVLTSEEMLAIQQVLTSKRVSTAGGILLAPFDELWEAYDDHCKALGLEQNS